MTRKTVTLTEESYKLLLGEKRPGETFSEVVRRLVRPSLYDFVGAWDHIPKRDIKAMKRTILRRRRASALKRAPRTRRR